MTITKPIMLDETGEKIVEALNEVKNAIQNQSGSGSGSASIELAQTLEGNEDDKAPSVKAVNDALKEVGGGAAIEIVNDRSSVFGGYYHNKEGTVPSVELLDYVSRSVVRFNPQVYIGPKKGVFGWVTQNDESGNPTSSQEKYGLRDTPYADYVALYSKTATLRTSAPIEHNDAANKEYVDAEIIPLKGRMTAAEAALEGRLYETQIDDTTDRISRVPAKSLPYACIESFGDVVNREFQDYTADMEGRLDYYFPDFTVACEVEDIEDGLVVGKKFTLSGEVLDGSDRGSFIIRLDQPIPFDKHYIRVKAKLEGMFTATNTSDAITVGVAGEFYMPLGDAIEFHPGETNQTREVTLWYDGTPKEITALRIDVPQSGDVYFRDTFPGSDIQNCIISVWVYFTERVVTDRAACDKIGVYNANGDLTEEIQNPVAPLYVQVEAGGQIEFGSPDYYEMENKKVIYQTEVSANA